MEELCLGSDCKKCWDGVINYEGEWDTQYDLRFLKKAREVSEQSTCLSRKVGAVIARQNSLLALGYNGAPKEMECIECLREGSKSGKHLDKCLSIHAEQRAIIDLLSTHSSPLGCTLYCTTLPCATCMKLIVEAGIKRVVFLEDYNSPLTYRIANECGIALVDWRK